MSRATFFQNCKENFIKGMMEWPSFWQCLAIAPWGVAFAWPELMGPSAWFIIALVGYGAIVLATLILRVIRAFYRMCKRRQ